MIPDDLAKLAMEGVDGLVAIYGQQTLGELRDSGLRALKLRMSGVDFFEFRIRDVVANGVRQNEVAVRKPLHRRAGAQAIGAVIGEIRFAEHEQTGDRAPKPAEAG